MILTQHSKYLPPALCFLTKDDAMNCFREAYKLIYGDYPYKQSLCILVAQSALETGNWKNGFYAWNFGNTRIPGNDPDKLKEGQYFTMYKCSEIIDNKEKFFYPPDPMSIFEAFKTAEEGTAEHLKFLQKDRYKKAWSAVIKGDPELYCKELKAAGYFTANLNMYMKGVVRITESLIKNNNIPEEIFTEEERKKIESLNKITISNSIYDYFKNSRSPDDDYDYYRIEKKGFLDSIKRFFGG